MNWVLVFFFSKGGMGGMDKWFVKGFLGVEVGGFHSLACLLGWLECRRGVWKSLRI